MHVTQDEPLRPDLLTQLRDLDLAAMRAVSLLLQQLPLQPHDPDSGDLMKAKSELFLRYFSLFHNILNECSDPCSRLDQQSVAATPTTTTGDRPHSSPVISSSSSSPHAEHELRRLTIRAMSNLLSANIDSGLKTSLALGYHRDLQTRAAFMEVLTTILQQGTEFEMLAETILHDRYEQLVSLVTMMGDRGDLPIAMALVNVVSSSHMDELARVLVTLFDAQHMLSHLLWNIFNREVEGSDCMQTLLRGNSLGSKVMAFCFRIYGTAFLKNLLEPLILPLIRQSAATTTNAVESSEDSGPTQVLLSYEVDPARISEGEDIEVNRQNLKSLTQTFFDAITESADQFPPQLRSMAHCLFQLLNKRFPDMGGNVSAVGTVFFLRFINPAIVTPFEMGVISEKIDCPRVRRGLMLMSKVLQNIANHVEFSKEQHMLCFNDFLRGNFDQASRWVQSITADCAMTDGTSHGPEEETRLDNQSISSLPNALISSSVSSVVAVVPTSTPSSTLISDANVQALHRLLWTHQEQVGEHMSCCRDYRNAGRRPFDKLSTLLAYLGPPASGRPTNQSHWSSAEMMSTKFEEIMSRFNMHEKDEFKAIKGLNVFYQAGVSKQGNPVFYYIARRFLIGEMNGDLLIYHTILTLKPFCSKNFELVIDLTHCSLENRFRQELLQKWFAVLPDLAYEKCVAAYVYNCNTWVREFCKCHEKTLSPLKGNRRLIFLDGLQRLSEYIEPVQQHLPQSTLVLEEDQKVYTGLMRLMPKDSKVSFKIGPNSIAVTSTDKSKVLGHSVFLNDVFLASEIEEICLVDEDQFTLGLQHDSAYMSFVHTDCESIVRDLIQIRTRWELSQPTDVSTVHSKLRPQDVPASLLNMALLNLGSRDQSLRTAAYNLMCTVIQAFDLVVDEEVMQQANPDTRHEEDEEMETRTRSSTITSGDEEQEEVHKSIKQISEQLSSRASHLTLEFLEEAIRGFQKSGKEEKNLCLEYMVPWLGNLSYIRKHADSKKKSKLTNLIETLSAMSLEEKDACPSIQDKLWPVIGGSYEYRLQDLPLDSPDDPDCRPGQRVA